MLRSCAVATQNFRLQDKFYPACSRVCLQLATNHLSLWRGYYLAAKSCCIASRSLGNTCGFGSSQPSGATCMHAAWPHMLAAAHATQRTSTRHSSRCCLGMMTMPIWRSSACPAKDCTACSSTRLPCLSMHPSSPVMIRPSMMCTCKGGEGQEGWHQTGKLSSMTGTVTAAVQTCLDALAQQRSSPVDGAA